MATPVGCVNILLQLDKSSPQFPEHLSRVLARTDFDESIQDLGEKPLMSVIENLDKALDKLSPASITFKQTHSKLQEICTSRVVLPSSHELLKDALDIAKHPFTSGGFSDIYEGKYNGSKICVKELRIASDSDSKKAAKVLCRQVLIWKRLVHPNIVPFRGATIHPLQIASEWMPGGDLTTYVNSNQRTNRVALLADIASGLGYLHSLSVIHGDLKGPNILVDAFHNARITDFDLSQHTLGEILKAEGQSARWTAPEVLAEKGLPSTEADVFSFAMVTIEVFTGNVPFNNDTSVETMVAIMSGERPPRPIHEALTDRLWGLTQRCWAGDPQKRPQMWEVLEVTNPSPSPTPPDVSTRLGKSDRPDASCRPAQPEPPSQSSPTTSDVPIPVSNLQQQPKEYEPSNATTEAFFRCPEESDCSSNASDFTEWFYHSPEEYDPSSNTPDSTEWFYNCPEESDPSDEYQKLLQELLHHENLKPHAHVLRKKNLRGIVDVLDEALGYIPVTDALFEKTLRVCGKHEVLPSSCLVPGGRLLDREELPVAGCSEKVCQAELDGKKVRIKVLGSYAQDISVIREKLYGEVVLWRRLQHPNIVPVLGVTTGTPLSLEIVCDWMENGSITEYMDEHPQVDCIDLLRDVANGLYYLHSYGIIHGDLKAANILIDKDGRARLTDFGLTSITRGNKSDTLPPGLNSVAAMTWVAPGILNGGAVTKEVDVFMFAMVAAETFTRHSIRKHQVAIPDAPARESPERLKKVLSPDEFWELMQRCWNPDPVKRPTTSELHDFFRSLHTGEQEAHKSPPLSPGSYTVVGDDDGGASEPPPDPSIEDSQKGDHKRMLGIRIKIRERYRRSIMPQGHDQVIGGGESSTGPAAQALLQARRKETSGGGVGRRLRKLGKRSTV